MADPEPRAIPRRHFLRSMGAAAFVAGLRPTRPGGLGRRRPPSVAVFGGGVAGLTAAHELAERGFEVTVYERRAWGGKARSMGVPGTAERGRRPLPGEHGWRVEFGFYQNLVDTLRRIPFGSNPKGVFDNLVHVPQFVWAREDGRELTIPVDPRQPVHTPAQVIDLLVGLGAETDLPPEAVTHFANRMAVFMSSSEARRRGQWERTAWSTFVGSERYSDDYRKLIGETFSQWIQASKADSTQASFSAWVVEIIVYNLLGRGANGPLVRIFDAPTNEAWIEPWTAELKRLGVRLRQGCSLERLEVRDGRMARAWVRSPRGLDAVRADWYVCALPVEHARRLWDDEITSLDPRLGRMSMLQTDWMTGIQFYLNERPSLFRGHFECVDAPWSIGSISQQQFWQSDMDTTYGDGRVRDCLSVIVSNWNEPGVLFGKPARECTPGEIAREAWEQIKRHVNDTGETLLTDDLVHSWHLDPGLVRRNGGYVNEDELAVPTVNSLQHRPDVGTALPNLLLTGDYLASDWHVGNMETANYNSRRAVNELLERADSNEPKCDTIGPYRPPEWEAAKAVDQERYERGQPNLLDTEAIGPLPSRDRDLVRQLGLESILKRDGVRV